MTLYPAGLLLGYYFNLTKCDIMSITGSPLKFPAGYRLCNSPLESISCHKYLGVFIQGNLEWDSHVKSVKHKAMKILGLLRRNFSGSSQYVKTQAYNSLVVRPHVEYASVAWSPFEKQHKSVRGCPTLRYKICLFRLFTVFQRNFYAAFAGLGHS